jgi:hypothetical protein
MKQFLLFLTFSFVALATTIAQPQVAPQGAEWWYGFKGGFIYQEGWNHFIYEKDTMVAGMACKKLIQNQYSRSNVSDPYSLFSLSRFIAQKGDSVFVYSDPEWLFRWRTNPPVGSTFEIQKYSWSSAYKFTIKVDSIKTVNLGGQSVKKIWIKGTSNVGIGGGSVVIYDKIGPEFGDFDYVICWGATDCFPSSLCKYKDNQFPLFEFSSSVCDLITPTKSPIQAGVLPVSPNPCHDILRLDVSQLESTHLTLSVFDQAGKLLKTLKCPFPTTIEVQTGDLLPGVYQYQLTGNNAVYSGRFVKI